MLLIVLAVLLYVLAVNTKEAVAMIKGTMEATGMTVLELVIGTVGLGALLVGMYFTMVSLHILYGY